MDIMNLIEKNNSLYFFNDERSNKKLTLVSEENFNEIKSSHIVINNELSLKMNKLNLESKDIDNINMVSINPITNALKLVEKGKIIKHIDRKDFLKISYPIIATKEDLHTHLISNDYSWNLNLFVKNNNFKIFEI